MPPPEPNPIGLGGFIGRRQPPRGATRIGTMGGQDQTRQGMISAQNFTDNDGDLYPTSFRFLNSIFNCIRYLEAYYYLMEGGVTVANLPAAASSQGMRSFATDANATTFYSVVVGGGSNYVPVFSDGTNWRIG